MEDETYTDDFGEQIEENDELRQARRDDGEFRESLAADDLDDDDEMPVDDSL